MYRMKEDINKKKDSVFDFISTIILKLDLVCLFKQNLMLNLCWMEERSIVGVGVVLLIMLRTPVVGI